MFVHDALIAEQSGVATVWLISTLGSKSSYKRITKKDIQQVSIPETCDLIKNPPKPIALRLTSSLLYGVALVYKQKTEYLNNDTINIKSRLQRDLLTRANSDRILIKTTHNILKTRGSSNPNHQAFLNDDPFFDVDSLLPPISNLDFLQLETATQSTETSRRKGIRDADLASHTVSFVLSSMTKSTDESTMVTRNLAVDDLDNNNPEFAFDDNGMLLELPDDTNIPNGSQIDDLQGGEADLGFNFDFDDVIELQPEEVGRIEELGEGTPLQEPKSKTTAILHPPKKKSGKRTRSIVADVIFDDHISLNTDDLRHFRDNYVSKMETRAVKKIKKSSPLEIIDGILAEITFLPNFQTTLEEPEQRGRSRHRDIEEINDDDDFVDGLMRNRRSSGSIEIRRNRSSSRRDSRASISGIDLPLGENTETFDRGFDFDFGDVGVDNLSDTAEQEGSLNKRSSSSIRRFQTLDENIEINEFDLDFNIDPIRQGDRPVTPSQFIRSSQLGTEENSEIARKNFKFLRFIEVRAQEICMNKIPFATLLEEETDKKNIIVKSFYEILQLATLNRIEIEANKSLRAGEIQTASDFVIVLKGYE